MYILSNGVKVTEKTHQKICKVIKKEEAERVYFLNMETGKLVESALENKKEIKELKSKSHLVDLPKVGEGERIKWIKKFFGDLYSVNILDDPERLQKALEEKAPMEKLERIIEEDSSGWVHGWVQYQHNMLSEKIEEWIKSPPLNGQDDLDFWYEDDCAACEFIKKMEKEKRSVDLNEVRDILDDSDIDDEK